MFSEGNAAHPVGCDSLLQIEMSIWQTFFVFEHAGRVWQPAIDYYGLTICSRLSHKT